MATKNLQIVQAGERTNAEGNPVGNIILLTISETDYHSIRPHREYVDLPHHLVLNEAGGRQLLFLFRRVVHDHELRAAVRTLPFEKNLFIRGVHNKLNVAMWAFDLTMVEFHMPDIFFLCGRHRGRYLVSENSGPADLLRTFMQQANRDMLTAVLLMSRFRMQHTAL